jgi:hypothetical protein
VTQDPRAFVRWLPADYVGVEVLTRTDGEVKNRRLERSIRARGRMLVHLAPDDAPFELAYNEPQRGPWWPNHPGDSGERAAQDRSSRSSTRAVIASTRVEYHSPPMSRILLRIPLAATGLLFAISFLPRIAGSPECGWRSGGVRSAACWAARALAPTGTASAHTLRPVRSHWVQALVQFSIYLYWGWVWRPVYDYMPVLLGQVVFLYTFDMLLQWSRRRSGSQASGRSRSRSAPISSSGSATTGSISSSFSSRWARSQGVRALEARRPLVPHLQSVGLLADGRVDLLLATGKSDITWEREIATTFAAPDHIYLWVFLGGLVVQSFFRVTLVTFGASSRCSR